MMAVTASTSSTPTRTPPIQLWKNTAGTHPPQPVDERAFYEKVWAQNFSRSQVDYQIPTKVLTATSPISLSPFADGILVMWVNPSLVWMTLWLDQQWKGVEPQVLHRKLQRFLQLQVGVKLLQQG